MQTRYMCISSKNPREDDVLGVDGAEREEKQLELCTVLSCSRWLSLLVLLSALLPIFFPTNYFSVFFCCCCCRTEKIYFPSTIFSSFFTSLVFFSVVCCRRRFFSCFSSSSPRVSTAEKKILNYYRVTFRFPSFILFPLPRSYHHPSCDFLQYIKKRAEKFFHFLAPRSRFFFECVNFFSKNWKSFLFHCCRSSSCV